VTRANVIHRPPWPERIQALGVSEEPIRLAAADGGSGPSLFVEQQYEILQAPEELGSEYGPWKVSTRAYRYRIDVAGRELLLWHWHPSGKSQYTTPHLHAQAGDLMGLHLPTGRMSLEAVIRLLVTELGVRPLRPDWLAVLDATEAAFLRWRTWG
jgi:hypothetical protein